MSHGKNALDPVVIDNGSGILKVWTVSLLECVLNFVAPPQAGFADDDAPRSVFPTVVGRCGSRWVALHGMTDPKDAYVGSEAQQMRDLLTLRYPIERGIVTDWDGMEKIWHCVFHDELRVDPEERAVLMTDAPFTPAVNRERMTQIIFETFNVPSFFVSSTATLALYASGATDGFVVECGDGISTCIPFHDGHPILANGIRTDIAGAAITEHLTRILAEKGHYGHQKETVDRLKEELAFVALDYHTDLRAPFHCEEEYLLPGGEVVTIGEERFRCAEQLFAPSVVGKSELGIHECAYRSIMKCESAIRGNMFGHLVLAGGSTKLPGFVERMTKEFTELVPSTTKVNIVAPKDRQHSVWIGGAILAALPNFQPMWINKAEYDEVGPTIVHRNSQGF